MEKERELLRLAITPHVVGAAKTSYAANQLQLLLAFDKKAEKHNRSVKDRIEKAKEGERKEAEFRATLDYAVRQYLAKIDAGLEEIGFRPTTDQKPRVWSVSKKTIKKLDAVAARHDLPRTLLIRACLALAADQCASAGNAAMTSDRAESAGR